MNRYYSVKPISEPTSKINIRFYYTTADFSALSLKAANLVPTRTDIARSNLYGFKINDIATQYEGTPSAGHTNIPLATAYNTNGFAQYKNGNVADTANWLYTNWGNNVHSMDYTVGHLGSGGMGIGSTSGQGALMPQLFIFTGNGNWSNAGNWLNNAIPPAVLPNGYQIVINPIVNGECVLDISQKIAAGGNLTVNANKKLTVKGNLSVVKN